MLLGRLYTCYDDLVGKTLQRLDQVRIPYEYLNEVYFTWTVQNCYLSNVGFLRNVTNAIFEHYGINKREFFDRQYGYKSIEYSFWSSARDGDFEALTRAVLELYRLIEEPETIAETIDTLFVD